MDVSDPILGRLSTEYAAGRSLVLLFDYDGTLTTMERHLKLAKLPVATRRLLQGLANLPRVFVGVVSSRSLDDLKEMVGLPNLYYAGTGGLELDLLGVRLTHPREPEGRDLLGRLLPQLKELVADYPGAWVEEKPVGLTIHYRNLYPLQIACLLDAVREALADDRGSLRIVDGSEALEVTPDLGWTKGTAVQSIIEDASRTAMPFYAGDAANDVDAFAAVEDIGGLVVGVGPSAPPAPHRLQNPQALARLLDRLLTSLAPALERRPLALNE